MMKTLIALLLATLSLSAAPISVVPHPQSLKHHNGAPHRISDQTQLIHRGPGAREVSQLLATQLQTRLQLKLHPVETNQNADNTIILEVKPANGNPESYTLTSHNNKTLILAPHSRGLVNGMQTLLQLIPEQGTSIPSVTINDTPAYPWRGMMLDVSRYFFNKEYVKRYLDMMAMHKLNVLHWHLIDDAGWRIEIKKYPKLTEIGAFRGEGPNRRGGYYTQDDIREIVAYAQARNITIVPEIELPAHTLPALVAYPHLGCFNKQFKVPTRHFISQDLYCPGKESTWTFLEDVFDEVCDLFPGTYIHIGGDEAKYSRWAKCPDCQKTIQQHGLKNEHALQGWMTTRVENYLATKNKRIIGWDEIMAAGVSNRAGIMTWHRPNTAVQGARQGNPVVMSLTSHAYFDVPESKLEGEPPAASWIPPISLEKSYHWDPTPDALKGTPAAKNIRGASACVWTDMFLHKPNILADKPGEGTSRSEAYVDYLSLPRMAALAEVTWTARQHRDYEHFSERMKEMYPRYDRLGYQYRVPVPEVSIQTNPEKTHSVSATSPVKGGSVRYTTDGSNPTAQSKELLGSINIANINNFRAATFTAGNQRQSLSFRHIDPNNRFAHLGRVIGHWKSGKIGNRKPKELSFNATGHINGNGTYLVTFQYTGGQQRLDIDGIRVLRNNSLPVGEDIHHGFTGGTNKNNSYRIQINQYETGAAFTIKAMAYGDEGDDSNGVVLIKKIK